VGIVLAPEPGRRVGREQRPVNASPERSPHESPAASSSTPKPPEETRTVEPTNDLPADSDADEGTGWVEVDFEGFDGEPMARIDGVGMEGLPDYEERGSGDGVVRFEVAAGEYRVSWRAPGDLRRYAARVHVESGRTTRLDAANPDYALPDSLSAGLGILDVRLVPADGRAWEGVTVSVVGVGMFGREETERKTNAEGRCRFRLRAGDYELGVNARKMPLTLAAGQRRAVEFGPADEGDLVVECSEERAFALRSRDGQRNLSRFTNEHEDVVRVGYLFIPPGVYDLSYRPSGRRRVLLPGVNSGESSARRIAELVVRPREATVFRFRPPTNALTVTVLPGEVPIRGLNPILELTTMDVGNIPSRVVFRMANVLERERRVLRAHLVELGAARYRLRLHVPDALPIDTEVAVGVGESRVELRLEKG
jgi:hypothetical protein